MSAFTDERVLSVHRWTEHLFTFTTTRNLALRCENGHFEVTGSLYRTLCTTNPIENLNGSVAHYCRNVKRWGDGQMVLRWVASALNDAATRMRKLRGCSQLRSLLKALDGRRSDTSQAADLKAA
jgi:hypothetical protein